MFKDNPIPKGLLVSLIIALLVVISPALYFGWSYLTAPDEVAAATDLDPMATVEQYLTYMGEKNTAGMDSLTKTGHWVPSHRDVWRIRDVIFLDGWEITVQDETTATVKSPHVVRKWPLDSDYRDYYSYLLEKTPEGWRIYDWGFA